jgi:hypothetical protein
MMSHMVLIGLASLVGEVLSVARLGCRKTEKRCAVLNGWKAPGGSGWGGTGGTGKTDSKLPSYWIFSQPETIQKRAYVKHRNRFPRC